MLAAVARPLCWSCVARLGRCLVLMSPETRAKIWSISEKASTVPRQPGTPGEVVRLPLPGIPAELMPAPLRFPDADTDSMSVAAYGYLVPTLVEGHLLDAALRHASILLLSVGDPAVRKEPMVLTGLRRTLDALLAPEWLAPGGFDRLRLEASAA
jgi:hypothetical protein